MSGVQTLSVGDDDADVRLDRWFRKRYPGLTHGKLEKLLRTGQIRVDGRRAKAGLRLAAGNQVRVPPLGAESEGRAHSKRAAPPARDEDLAAVKDWVIYRDENLIAINKPPGLAVQGGSGIRRHLDAMLGGLQFDAPERPRLVHRLDKDTSGVLLLARNAVTARSLTKMFRDKKLRKVYWALTLGIPHPEKGRIDAAIAKRPVSGGGERMVAVADGAEATTYYTTLEAAGNSIAWLALLPLTGRTHQLRAHCADVLKCPIQGDRKYLPDTDDAPQEGGFGAGLHLHARSLSLPHPGGGGARRARLDIVAPLPEHMVESWRHLDFEQNLDGDPFAALQL
ncbi:MAG: RluA family pseudouridine synthase [Rhodospirillaceae bacterium]|jgi:23S rRNA pseudouridine955/2504/2580 synthase|nr:RluA family pseudouridine synthase [Rhodospirillaceae bacterium]MBT5038236.1 RluA family pseudouridine synthase [Rhodospirillaceae bacterium]MBT5676527.1 RluA family pseudouridine synthase [Rhodospirillaceae bacterium]